MYRSLRRWSDETRLQILDMLSSKEMCACKILAPFHISQPTLSYHMRILMESCLVTSRKEGPWVYYRMDPAGWKRFSSFSRPRKRQGIAPSCGLCAGNGKTPGGFRFVAGPPLLSLPIPVICEKRPFSSKLHK